MTIRAVNFTVLLLVLSVSIACERTREDSDRAHTATDAGDSVQQVEELDPTDPDFVRAARKKYVDNYGRVESFDTTFAISEDDTARVQTRHYCTFDSSVLIPGAYVREDTSRSFRTHNFAQDVKISVNGKTLFARTITKQDFRAVAPAYLLEYGVIVNAAFYEYHRGYQYFHISYSLSIPCTDVGVGLSIIVDRAGCWITTYGIAS
jgi:hypothetical protein